MQEEKSVPEALLILVFSSSTPTILFITSGTPPPK